MARFNLEDYETVESRIKKFYEQNPDGRIVTKWANNFMLSDQTTTYIVKASVYLTAGDQANKLPKATGLAVEVTGTGGANNGSALENAETSAIGRALANMNLSGNKRASREEMQKVQRIESQTKDWLKEADKIMNIDAMRWLYAQAKESGASQEILEELIERARVLGAESESAGAGGSVPAGKKNGAGK